jgi:tubulin polyglutamylase complex subunit 2
MERRETFDKLALSCITYLESFPECKNVNFQCGDGAASHESIVWEKRNAPYKLPKDFKNFVSIFNGIHLSWNVDLGDRTLQVGEMRINRLEAVKSMEIEGTFEQTWNDGSTTIPDAKNCAAFVLDSHCGIGEIVFLYRLPPSGADLPNSFSVSNEASEVDATGSRPGGDSVHTGSKPTEDISCYENPEVWFVDHSSRWHFISKTFTQYFRLLVLHMGIADWQLAFAPEGLSETAQYWMGLFCKERLIVDRVWREKRK